MSANPSDVTVVSPDDLPLKEGKSLAERYDYIIKESVPLEERWPNPPQVIIPFLARLRKLDISLLADHPKWDSIGKQMARFGSAVIVPNRKTFIWINMIKHCYGSSIVIDLELIDTIIHEAVHATGVILGRFSIQPEDITTDAYFAEEVCALAGSAAIHRDMKHDAAAQRNKRSAQDEASKLGDRHLRRLAIDQGNRAAQFLIEKPI